MTQIGARAHDYGRDVPEKLFGKIAADGFTCVQLALKKAIAGVNGPADVTPELLKFIRSPRLKIIFDPVNLLSEEDVDGQRSLWDRCFSCFAPRLPRCT